MSSKNSIQKVTSDDRIELALETVPTDDHRSYHVSSRKIADALGIRPRKSVEDAVRDLLAAFKNGRLKNPMEDIRYNDIKTMQAIALK